MISQPTSYPTTTNKATIRQVSKEWPTTIQMEGYDAIPIAIVQRFSLFIQHFPLFIYNAILVRHFVFFFLSFFVLNSSYSTKRHNSYSFFFFLGLPFVLFFFYIYCYIDITNFTIFSQLLRCQFFISQNKIIKYEIVTNHNWK